ncbi:hypothetical protein GCM10022243_05930 [Saccharothrix violaceirubra]|uniref:Uncharacterized protein n=1 Tax=Saccharothrix violaceirubra TaxID=413306 RepID=A0A7W7WU04_9PSEU|nr:hypothetical protein [Saccharothrix violaceirubra]MBB4963003.1 hypothetical protein [Saccharothrix violaceirubra]
MQRIGNLLLDVAPPDFRRVDLLVRLTVGVQDAELTVYRQDGTSLAADLPDGLLAAFTEMRQVLYRPGRGAWFSARCVVNAPARIDITYNVDHDPKFVPEIPAEHFARDLEVFPRDEAFTPDWLRRKLAGAEEQNA